MKIRSKRQFFEMWEAGLLGNRTRLWRDPEVCVRECTELGIHQVGFRQIGRTGGGKWQKAPLSEVHEVAAKWHAEGRDFIMDDGAPDEYRTLQGELCRTERGLEGFLSLGSKLPMRPDMVAGNMKSYSGAAVHVLLNQYMDPPSRDDVDAILELFPDAAIEFTCFSVTCGVLRRNTLFWEVRDY
jgi:hypothetical protein